MASSWIHSLMHSFTKAQLFARHCPRLGSALSVELACKVHEKWEKQTSNNIHTDKCKIETVTNLKKKRSAASRANSTCKGPGWELGGHQQIGDSENKLGWGEVSTTLNVCEWNWMKWMKAKPHEALISVKITFFYLFWEQWENIAEFSVEGWLDQFCFPKRFLWLPPREWMHKRLSEESLMRELNIIP